MNKFSNVAKACLKAIQAIARFIVLAGMLIVSLLTILVGKLLAILVVILLVILGSILLAILVASIFGVWSPEILSLNDSINPYLNKNKDILASITLFAGIGLFSFMLQRYAKDGKGEKQEKKIDIWRFLSAIKNNIVKDFQVLGWCPGQKTLSATWKAMTQFLLYSLRFSLRLAVWLLLLFALLATFRATLFLLSPLPEIILDPLTKIILDPLTKIIQEKFSVSKPVVIILLIICFTVVIGWFSGLLRKKIKEGKSNTKDKTQQDSRKSLFDFRILLPFVILVLATLPMPIHFFPLFENFTENIYENWKSKDKPIITIIALCTAIGLFYPLLKRYAKDFWQSLLNISEKISTVFQNPPWLSKINIDKNQLKETISEKIQLKETLQNSLILVFALWIGYILFFLGYLPIKDLSDWRFDVIDRLTDIKTDTSKLMILRASGYSPAFLSTNEDTSFLLVYPPQGNLGNKKGICPADGSRELEWLQFLKTVFSKCSKDTMKLRVQGFASVAPITVNALTGTAKSDILKADSLRSDSLNCEIANQRAEALIYFLTLPDTIKYTMEGCKTALEDDRRWGRVEGKYGRPDALAWNRSNFTVTYDDSPRVQWEGSNLTVTYKPWENYDEMAKAKPVQDSQRRDLEFLNRSVQIIIEEGGFLKKAVPASQQAMDNAENTN